MKPSPTLTPAAQFFIAALVVLGLLGGSLIVAHSGFETSPKRGGASVFVPAPQAYVMAAIMYAMGFVGLLALLRHHRAALLGMLLGAALFAGAAVGLVLLLQPA
ncbi:MAG TPA: hypothetical protein VFK82_05835 [Burkholderiaceae bacterium]|nr:hypothetical protein [Burkholderiaceae bacterium]